MAPDHEALAGAVAEHPALAAKDAEPAVRRLPSQRQRATLAVESNAERHQIADAGGPLIRQYAHRLGVAQATAHLDRVGHVLGGGVARAERGCDATLGVD